MSCFSKIIRNALQAIHRVISPWFRPNRYLPMILCVLPFSAAGSALAGPNPPATVFTSFGQSNDRIEVVHYPRIMETIYSLAGEYCQIRWTVYNSEANRGVIKHSAECEQSLQVQLPAIGTLLREIMQVSYPPQSFHTLFWGRLLTTSSQRASEMSFRLTLAAHKSTAWDMRRGKPRQGSDAAFVKHTANNMMIYPELDDLFRTNGLYISLKAAEKVLVTEAKNLPFYNRLKKHGVMPDDRLPYDAMVWFSISPTGAIALAPHSE